MNPRSARTLVRRSAVAAALAAATCGISHAADPVAGGARYQTDCNRSGCHNTSTPFVTNASKIANGRNAASVINSAIGNNTGGMGSLRSSYPSGGAALADMAAYLGNSPSTLTFTSTAVGSTSATQTVTMKASSSLALNSIVVTSSGDFARAGGTCGSSLAAGTSCTIAVTFAPTASGTRTGTLSIAHSATPGNPVLIALSGTATGGTPAPIASAAPTSLAFNSTVIGTPSAAQTVTLSNGGTAALSLGAIATSGDYSISGGTCSAPGTVAAGSSCTSTLVFTPAATGARSGTLTFSHNAGSGSTAVSLSGTGVNAPAPAVTLSVNAVAFGSQVQNTTSSPARTVTLTNSGNAALTISSIGATSPFTGTSNCPSSLAAAASCTISLSFSPTAVAAASGSLSVVTNAAGSPHTVALSGTGTAVPPPLLTWSSSTVLSLPSNTSGGTSPTSASRILTNQGQGSVTLQTVAITGTNASEFTLGTGNTCVANLVLAQGASCNLLVEFLPAAPGLRTASLNVASSGTNPPTLGLSGTGTAPAAPQLAAPQSIAISALPAATGEQTFPVGNSGTATLSIGQIVVGSGPFTLQTAASGPCPTGAFTLTPGSSCNVSVMWTSSSTASDTGTINVLSANSALLQSITVNAQREQAAATVPSATPTMENAGGGGCSISRTDSPFDPVLWLLAALACAVLWHRRASR